MRNCVDKKLNRNINVCYDPLVVVHRHTIPPEAPSGPSSIVYLAKPDVPQLAAYTLP